MSLQATLNMMRAVKVIVKTKELKIKLMIIMTIAKKIKMIIKITIKVLIFQDLEKMIILIIIKI